jgi:hypothetical protein
MQTLVDRLRQYTNAGTAQYTVGSSTYWSDTHLQDVLDRHQTWVVEEPLTWQPELQADGVVDYLTAIVPYRNWEEATSGAAYWQVRQTTGSTIGTADYSANYASGRITFAADQGGTAYMLTGFSYDIYGAAIEIIRHKLAYVDLWYDFSDNNQSFSRSQVADNLKALIAEYEPKIGDNLPGHSGDLGFSQFVRIDINAG